MAMYSNSYIQRTFIDEINSILIDFFETSKKFIYKHHRVLGYF